MKETPYQRGVEVGRLRKLSGFTAPPSPAGCPYIDKEDMHMWFTGVEEGMECESSQR